MKRNIQMMEAAQAKLQQTLQSDFLTQGPKIAEFEKAFAVSGENKLMK
jgi:dTDP-4-amino-4,6-dideoxygalactose transaminase